MKHRRSRRRFYPHTSLKNKKRANGLGGRQATSNGPSTGFQYFGSGLMEGLLSRLVGKRMGRAPQGGRG